MDASSHVTSVTCQQTNLFSSGVRNMKSIMRKRQPKMTFEHKDLDCYARLIGRAILEYRDPNDGQSSDPDQKSRHQYTLVNGVLLSRHLPPVAVGDAWIDTGVPSWEQIQVPTNWTLLMAWCASLEADFGIELEPHCDRMLYGCNPPDLVPQVTMAWSKKEIVIHGTYWPQTIPCPHCHDWIVWAEAGYVPGYRICVGCNRHWMITLDSGAKKGWTLRRK